MSISSDDYPLVFEDAFDTDPPEFEGDFDTDADVYAQEEGGASLVVAPTTVVLGGKAFHHKYALEDGDIVLRSADGVCFKVLSQ